MLINTVILFLHDALPVFIIVSLLLAYKNSGTRQKSSTDSNLWLYASLAIGLILASLLTLVSSNLSSAVEGAGNEIFYATGHLFIYIAIAAMLGSNIGKRNFCYFITITAQTLYGASFIIFISAFWTQYGAAQAMIIGIILGIGICISIAILLYFSLTINHPWQKNITSVMILAFASGQLMITTNLLTQIDFMPSSAILWNSHFVINEKGEIGQFLTALLGYDATPTARQLAIYIIALIAPLIYIAVRRTFYLTKEEC